MLMAGVLSSLAQTRHDEKLEKYKTIWNSLVPSYNKLQYAGSMGLLSFGVGWDYGKKNQWETDLFIGYLPKFDGKEGHVTFTLKENYIPWKKTFGKERWLAEPLTVSLYINKILGDEFWDKEPDRYPDAMDSIVPMAYGNLALDLIGKGMHGRLVILRNGRYDNAPIEIVTSTKKLVDVDKFYNTERLRPKYNSFEFMPQMIL